MFPLNRNRRLRNKESLRNLIREHRLHPHDFIAPLFITEGKNKKTPIESMPGYYRLSIDNIKKEVKSLWSLGIQSVLLFPKVDDKLKDNLGKEALNPHGLIQKTIKEIKNSCPDITIISDVALDPYSIHGHDGIIKENKILNDETNKVLAEMALSHAKSGADIVAPSDMMDGRVLSIRTVLEQNNFLETGIMSYGAKFASSLYGPFRDALDSKPGFGDKKTYQMDFSNFKESISEIKADIEEGADIIMIKPGITNLDIINEAKNTFNVPIAVYQVSGEYSMIKAGVKMGYVNHNEFLIESLTVIKRAGANIIATYFAKEAVELIS
ncbi:MAG: porphobilinogen synthase [Flavobacteriaceae bacterium]|nr:porphobilinogen synthase [Flavobacteriaceae bacterium]|tara:strand:- start:62 stop:1036 length:975 start_codon:yes stop_codon:yes gene_type:complete